MEEFACEQDAEGINGRGRYAGEMRRGERDVRRHSHGESRQTREGELR